MHDKFYEKYKEQRKKELIAKAPKIQCPYCKKLVLKVTQEELTLVELKPEGLTPEEYQRLVKIKKSTELESVTACIEPYTYKSYIECPHYKMKIMLV